MKQILPLMCLVLIAAPAGVSAQSFKLVNGAHHGLSVKISMDDERRGRRRSDDSDNRREQGSDNFRQNTWRDERRNEDMGGRDNRINQAMAIAASRGRVLDAGPMGGSIFWVRVATERGRVDIIVDTASGRIVGEK